MNKYEAMFIISPELTEEGRKAFFHQVSEAITKNSGVVSQSAIWSERKKLYFPIKKHNEGVYYLVNFTMPPAGVKEIRHAFNLNENILRVLISHLE